MHKLKLDANSLDVLSFDSAASSSPGGIGDGRARNFLASEDVCLSVQVVCVSRPCTTS
ncbi:MAG TPA: hypothetical protein VFJ16_12765 [Longimicrobium sp.]|nr:hypothetical protein [Longimicrobium sp.]